MRHALLAVILCWIVWCSCDSKNAPAAARRNETEPEWSPQIVPFLDNVPSAVDGTGTARLKKPKEPVVAGTRTSFEIVYTVGESGIAPRGFVMLQVSPWWGWSPPQTSYPEGPGYTTVSTSFSKPVQVQTLPLNRVVVFSEQHRLEPGESITFRYSDARVDTFAEAEELFQIFVDGDGDGHSACLPDTPTIAILPAAAVRISVHAPSESSPGKTVEVQAAPLDNVGNWARFPPGAYRLAVTCDGAPAGSATLEATGGEKVLKFSYKPERGGIYFFEVAGPGELHGSSNVMLCQSGSPSLNLYFGDIHGHSRLSDGTGTPEDYYRYAREVSGLSIAALTDHADYGTILIEGKVWGRIKRAANDFYEPGRFVTFLGFEWTNWRFGHRNVYYRNGDGPVFRSVDPHSSTPQKLWALLQPYEAMTIAHHVGGGPIATDWSIPPDPKEFLVEICSIHGSSEVFGAPSAIYNPKHGAFVRDALARGYKLGIIASGDTHDGHPGQRSVGALVNGIVGVYAPALTREAVWEALKRRHAYGTSGPKIILNFRVGDCPMGSEVRWAASKGPLPIAVRAVGCAPIASVEIIRNGTEAFVQKGESVFAQLLLEDPDPPSGTSWYYTRIIQEDGQMAWSSPVWVSME
ncbi:MAG: hypothetical protein Kow0099_13870 [Candidatus Abyssubacteria bacterium]